MIHTAKPALWRAVNNAKENVGKGLQVLGKQTSPNDSKANETNRLATKQMADYALRELEWLERYGQRLKFGSNNQGEGRS